MKIFPLLTGNRSVTVQLGEEGLYELTAPVKLTLNGKPLPAPSSVVTSIYHLQPDTEYCLEAEQNGEISCLHFRTEEEVCSLDIRRFGAVGDGVHDDTPAIQTAILACPAHGRVLIPKGDWKVLPLFLKSGVRIELSEGASLKLETDRSRFPILPGMTLMNDPSEDLNLGTWEGNPLDCYASLITGIDVEDCLIYGEGTLDGCANDDNWWHDAKVRRGAWRGNLVFLNHCRGISLQGLRFLNSPSWNLHPYFSDELKFLNLSINAPAVSPNTDGFDPESCRGILMAGTRFDVGDDCIALKSGKLYMGRRYKRPCEDVEIKHCLMENGHGGMTIGSEMSGGVKNIRMHHCVMRNTDRGIRIKTRRSRGRDAVIEGLTIDSVRMEKVSAPFVINCLYYCDPDGHSEYVQTLEPQPVDERTPYIGDLTFRNIKADGAACAGYFLGLPEQPIQSVTLENVSVECDEDAAPMLPAMADCVTEMNKTGFVLRYVNSLKLDHVSVTGCDAPALQTECVGTVAQLGCEIERGALR